MKKDKKQRLFEVMSRLDKTFKSKLNENSYEIDEPVKDANDESNLSIGDVVTVSGLEGEYQIAIKHSEGKPFLMPFDMSTKKPIQTHKIYLTTLNNPEMNKILSFSDTGGGFMSENNLNENEINPKYTHFALLKDSKKFVNGWDFSDVDPEDLKQDKMHYFFQDIIDMDIDPKNVLVGTVKKFQKEGLDPFDSNNWYKFNADGWQEKDDLKERWGRKSYSTYGQSRDPKIITLRYDTVCDETGQQLKAGQEALYYPSSKSFFGLDTKQADEFYRWKGDMDMGYDY